MSHNDDSQQRSQEMRAITVSRSYGSGGGEIVARLAKRLNWRLVDHEVVAFIADQMGISAAEADARDEHIEGFAARLLSSMHLAVPDAPVATPSLPMEREATYCQALRQVVESAAHAGRVIIVGRAGQVLLAGWRDALHVRIVAPLALRIDYVARRERLTEAQARQRIQQKDRDRTQFLQGRYRTHPDDPLRYDLIINTAVLDLDSAVELIQQALQAKGRRLPAAERELGPAAGLAPYPAYPADLHPPEPASAPPPRG